MTTIIRPSSAHAVALAKAWLIDGYEGSRVADRRPWLPVPIPPSYGREEYSGALIVREGSPPKGYVLDTCTKVFAILPAAGKMKEFYPVHVCETEYRREHRAAKWLGLANAELGDDDLQLGRRHRQ